MSDDAREPGLERLVRNLKQVRETTAPDGDEGSPVAVYNRGVHALGETGRAPDDGLAFECFTDAAARGVPEAATNLGWMHDHGRGTALNHRAAYAWYRLAADRGSVQGLFNAGLARAEGRGCEQDLAEGITLLRRAGRAGLADGWTAAGQAALAHAASPEAVSIAVADLKHGAQAGSAVGAYLLAIAYEHGVGVRASREAHEGWLRVAASHGDPDALRDLAALTRTRAARAHPLLRAIATTAVAGAAGAGAWHLADPITLAAALAAVNALVWGSSALLAAPSKATRAARHASAAWATGGAILLAAALAADPIAATVTGAIGTGAGAAGLTTMQTPLRQLAKRLRHRRDEP